MGQFESHPTHYMLEKHGDTFVLISNEPEECFHFDPSESYMVSYAIDYQTDPNFSKKTLGKSTIADAQQVLNTLVTAGVCPRNNAALYVASKRPDDCTMAGMRRGFQEEARKVGPNGLFLFHFSGHGIKVRGDQWGLAPVDFDYTILTYLTATILNQWLHEVQCKAKHILFTLDCCYAGGIANELTSSGEFDLTPGLYVLTACTANETSLVLGPLGHSIFSFFLCRSISMLTQTPGQLPLRKIFNDLQEPSIALSSLIVSYSPTDGLKWGTMEPELKYFDLHVRAVAEELMGRGTEQTDAQLERYKYAVCLYDYSKPIPPLDDKSVAWLETAASEALIALEKKHLLHDRVLLAVLCSMLYSVASIEMACNLAKLYNPNHFITTFMHVVAAVDLIHRVEYTLDNFLYGWAFYDDVVKTNRLGDDGLKRLYRRALRNKLKTLPVQSGGEDFTDSAEQVSLISCDLLV